MGISSIWGVPDRSNACNFTFCIFYFFFYTFLRVNFVAKNYTL